MKAPKMIVGLFLLITVGVINGYTQQEFTFTVTAANFAGIKASIDMPGLSGNPLAIIVATPVGDTELLNPHPVGAWYYADKWNLMNVDSGRMPLGAKYKIQFFTRPGPNQFLHLVTRQNIGAEGSYIDNPALNNNPNAQVKILQNHAPDVRSPYNLNRYEAVAAYSSAAGRWYIANTKGEALGAGSAFNVVVVSGSPVGTNTTPNIGTNPTGPIATTAPGAPTTTNPGVSTPTTTPSGPTPVGGPIALPGAQLPTKTPVRDWVLRADPQPSIAPNSDVLLFIHGMDSRAEEANDITKALFELKSGASVQPAPPAVPPSGPDPATVAGMQQILQKYESCILERYETVIDMINRGLDPKLSGLATTYGLQDRDQVKCVAGNTCSRENRRLKFAELSGLAASGNISVLNFEAQLKTIIPNDCFDCSKHLERHTKHVHCTMECGGNQGFDPLRPERSIGPCFETCKAGVDLEKLATDVIDDVRSAVARFNAVPPPTNIPSGTIASDVLTVQFNSCPIPSQGCPEQCDFPDDFSQGGRKGVLPPDYYVPRIPRELLDTNPPPGGIFNIPAARNIGSNEGRLNDALRAAASDRRPRNSLVLATFEFAKGNAVLGTAYADLSVTGRRAFEDFRAGGGPKEPFCRSLLSQRPTGTTEAAVLDACGKALDRAYRVANFLRTGQIGETPDQKSKKTTERQALGWIAVSGEDDQPHRPVNVPSSDHPQYDLDVSVKTPKSRKSQTLKVRARYTIAESKTANPGGSGKNLVIISLDLPTSGYTQNLDYEDISPLSEIGTVTSLPVPDFQATGRTPVLDFIEEFIVSFVETVDRSGVPVKNNIKAVMGGSLGGNMTFRLGRRDNVDWLPKFIVWSPASIWYSLGEGPDPLKHLGPRTAYEGADTARKTPKAGDRAAFFGSWDKPVLPLVIPMAQSDTWTSEHYPCKKSAIAAARLDRQETYNADFLAWHWRLGGEQLLYSHQTIDPLTNKARYLSNVKPMLLACGLEDTVAFNDICPATQNTAARMVTTPGKALFLAETGHSLDNERRTYFARQIVEFLGL